MPASPRRPDTPILFQLAVVLVCALGACADTDFDPGSGDGGETDCTDGEHRCVGQTYQLCQGGDFVTLQECAADKICLASWGCVECDPSLNRTCVGNDVYECSSSGKVGNLVEQCGTQTCSLGSCGGQSCAAGTGLIYLVDDANRFLSFNPENGANTLKVLGTLSCPAASSWPAWASPEATPFSMSVDRSGTAWVLYTSGEIFWVDINTVSCTATSFSKGQSGYQLFGMGFVSDTQGSASEKLFISGGQVEALADGNLGYIDPDSLAITTVSPLATTGTEQSPELTGTGQGVLYGFFPNGSDSHVREIDKSSGQPLQSWKVTIPHQGEVVAWAFAHWGGRFYIFVTTMDIFGLSDTSMVLLLDPDDGSTTTLLDNIQYRIVGAGVSTCAPTID